MKSLKPIISAAATCAAFISASLSASAQSGVAIPDKERREAPRAAESPAPRREAVPEYTPREASREVRPQYTSEPAAAPAPAPASTASIGDDSAYLFFGAGYFSVKPNDVPSWASYDGGGISLGGGFSFAESSIGRVRMNFDLGVFYGKTKDYEVYVDRGYMENHSSLYSIPVLFTPGYEFNLGSPRFRARVGVPLGATTFVSESYHSHGTASVSAAFTYGVDLGLTVKPLENSSLFLDLGFRYLFNTKAEFQYIPYFDAEKFKSESLSVQIGIGFRF